MDWERVRPPTPSLGVKCASGVKVWNRTEKQRLFSSGWHCPVSSCPPPPSTLTLSGSLGVRLGLSLSLTFPSLVGKDGCAAYMTGSQQMFVAWINNLLVRFGCFEGFPCGSAGKESACNAGDLGPLVGKIPWRRERLPTPVFWPEEFHGLYSPSGYRVGHDRATFNSLSLCFIWASQVALVLKNPPAKFRRHKRHGFDPWVRKIPWSRAWQPTPVFLPGESHGGLQSIFPGPSNALWTSFLCESSSPWGS